MTAVVVASLHKGLLIGVLQNDSANSSECLMANVWLMSENLVEGRNITTVLFHSATRKKFEGSIPDGVI